MKKINLSWLTVTALFAVTACTADDSWYDETLARTQTSTTTTSSDNSTSTTATADDVVNGVSTSGDVTSFSIALNKSTLAETYQADAGDEDYIENTTFDKTITITFSTTGDASVSGDDDAIISISGNDVIATNNTSNVIRYVLTGETSDGFFKALFHEEAGHRAQRRQHHQPRWCGHQQPEQEANLHRPQRRYDKQSHRRH